MKNAPPPPNDTTLTLQGHKKPVKIKHRQINWIRRNFCHLQSKCFFLGPIISSVVALHTDLARPWPAKLCRAASNLSFIVCPAIFSFLTWCCCWYTSSCCCCCGSTVGLPLLFYTNTHIHSRTMGSQFGCTDCYEPFTIITNWGKRPLIVCTNYEPTIQHLLLAQNEIFNAEEKMTAHHWAQYATHTCEKKRQRWFICNALKRVNNAEW